MNKTPKTLSKRSKWIFCCFLLSIPFLNYAQEKTLVLDPKNEAYVLRCFMDFDKKVKSHSIAVGDPTMVNYAIDANSGSLLKVWKGQFVDVAPMWIDRGGGFFKTPAVTKNLFDAPSLAKLNDKNEKWPDSVQIQGYGYRFKGYKVDKAGRPTFRYTALNMNVEDKYTPTEAKDGLTREISLGSSAAPNLYILLAKGTDIKKSGKNIYAVNGQSYSIRIDDIGKSKPEIRESNGGKELLVLLTNQPKIKYSILW